MKRAIARYFRGAWFNGAAAEQKRWTVQVVYLARTDYVEISKLVTASASELAQIIKNELAILRQQYAKVLWQVQRRPGGRYRLQFAGIAQAVIEPFVGRLLLIYPETWLVTQCLQPERLYLVTSAAEYWAYISADGTANFTDKKGLMQRSEYFLSAIGAAEQGNNVNIEPLVLTQQTAERTLLPKWYQWPGMLHYQAKQRQYSLTSIKSYLLLSAVITLSYAVVLSAALGLYHDKLQQDTTTQQLQAEALLVQRQQTEQLLQSVNRYAVVSENQGAYSAMLMFLTEQLPAKTVLRRIELSGNVAVIQGTAPSATEVLAKLGESAQVSEPRFDRPVQGETDGEGFTVSFIYKSGEAVNAKL